MVCVFYYRATTDMAPCIVSRVIRPTVSVTNFGGKYSVHTGYTLLSKIKKKYNEVANADWHVIRWLRVDTEDAHLDEEFLKI